jgi:hypothetical protein
MGGQAHLREAEMNIVRSSGSIGRRSFVASGIAVLAIGSGLAGCGGSSGSVASAPPAASVSAAAQSTSGTSTIEADPKALCTGLPAADVAALFKGPVGPAKPGAGSVTCSYSLAASSGNETATLSVAIDATYGAATYPNTSTALGADPKPISGVGDKAVWASSQPGYGAPNVVALKGNTSCYLQAPSDTAILTLATTNGSQVSDTAAASYAQKLAVLCTDVFAGK